MYTYEVSEDIHFSCNHCLQGLMKYQSFGPHACRDKLKTLLQLWRGKNEIFQEQSLKARLLESTRKFENRLLLRINKPLLPLSNSAIKISAFYRGSVPRQSSSIKPTHLFFLQIYISKMSLIPSFFGNRWSNVLNPFSLDIWDPFEGSPFSTTVTNFPSSTQETAAVANARIDWRETPEAHVFKVDVPGLKKEEVKVEVEDGRILQISGERSKEQEEKNNKWHRVERSSGKFLRGFRLPENAKLDQVKAAMQNGVLTVTVPKEDEKKPEVKTIDISG